MAKKEVKTDLWVASQLSECGIPYTPQGSDVKEIDKALSTASKRGTGKAGYPEYVSIKPIQANIVSTRTPVSSTWA